MEYVVVVTQNMVDKKKPVKYHLTDISNTLLARDWKGANNYGFIFVIDVE